MAVKERLIEYIKYKGISTREFCRQIGVSETYVNSMRMSIQPDKLIKIAHVYPDLNSEWLLTGEGEMIRASAAMPLIEREMLVTVGSEVFKDKLIDMFKNGEIFPASIVWRQHEMIVSLTNKIESLTSEVERLKIRLAQNGIDPQ